MTRKKINKNKNYTPYYIWGLHASISALNNDNRKIKNIYCSQLVFDKYLDNLVNIEINDSLNNDNTIIALDQVTDPQNVGAIIRTFNFFGGKNLIITKDHSSEINGSLAKSASGALENINIIKVTNLSMTLKNLRKKGFIIIGLDENSDVFLHKAKDYRNEKKVLVMGSEGKGLRRLTKENCDLLVSIANNNDSDFNTLNVSVSSALALYEFMGSEINN